MGPFLETAADLLDRGGWVMFPLLALGLLSLALSAERALFWINQHGPGSARRFSRLAKAVREADLAEARARAGEDRSIYGRLGSLLLSRDSAASGVEESYAAAQADRARRPFERFASTHATIVAAAPMLGILGTVTGIIDSFGLIGAEQTVSDPSLVAAGISEALFTTAFGLAVALVTLFPHALFRAQTERALDRVELLALAAMRRSA